MYIYNMYIYIFINICIYVYTQPCISSFWMVRSTVPQFSSLDQPPLPPTHFGAVLAAFGSPGTERAGPRSQRWSKPIGLLRIPWIITFSLLRKLFGFTNHLIHQWLIWVSRKRLTVNHQLATLLLLAVQIWDFGDRGNFSNNVVPIWCQNCESCSALAWIFRDYAKWPCAALSSVASFGIYDIQGCLIFIQFSSGPAWGFTWQHVWPVLNDWQCTSPSMANNQIIWRFPES